MKNLKEFAYNNIVDSISEGLLDDIDSTLNAADQYMDEQKLAEWSKNSRTPAHWWRKKVGFTVQGDFEISGIDTKEYTGPMFRLVKGNVTISNTQLENLEGIFMDGCVINGTLCIEDNPNLTSLKGCPVEVQTMIIADNKNLKDIDELPEIKLNLYAIRNGKKFNKEKLAEKFVVGKRINCSVEDTADMIDESIVNESFKIPQLAAFIDAVNRISTKDRERKAKLTAFLQDVAWDKVSNSHVSEYDAHSSEAVKAARLYITRKRRGFILLMDSEGICVGMIRCKKYYDLTAPGTSGWYREKDKWSNWFYEAKVDDLLWNIDKYADTIVTVDVDNVESVYSLRQERKNARDGATAYDKGFERSDGQVNAKQVRYYQDIADKNRERYKKMLQMMKANRAVQSNKFDSIKARVDKCFDRYTALISKMLKNPTKFNNYDLDWLTEKFSSYRSTKYGYSQSGLMISFERYVRFMLEAQKGKAYVSSGGGMADQIRQYEEKMEADLLAVESKLAELEAQ